MPEATQQVAAVPTLQKLTPADLPLMRMEGRFFYIGVNPKTKVLDAVVAQDIVQSLLQADLTNGHPIILVISGPGGEVSAAFGIADTLSMCRSPIYTVGLGEICSAHAHLFMMGEKRYLTPSATIMFHSPVCGTRGTPEEHDKQSGELYRAREIIMKRLLAKTKLNRKQVLKAMMDEKYWAAGAAKKAGISTGTITSWGQIAKLADGAKR